LYHYDAFTVVMTNTATTVITQITSVILRMVMVMVINNININKNYNNINTTGNDDNNKDSDNKFVILVLHM